jgi:hypothetical protein
MWRALLAPTPIPDPVSCVCLYVWVALCVSFDFSHTDIRFEFSVVVFARINSELLNIVVVRYR